MKESFKKIFKEKEYFRIGALVSVAAIVFLVLWGAGAFRAGEKEAQRRDTGGENIGSALDAHDIADQEARKWHSDAVLSTFTSNKAQNGEPIDTWQFIFISASAPRRGFIVDIEGNVIAGSREVDYVGTGAAFSEEGIITQGEAIRRIHALSGYEDEPILGIEAVYDPAAKSWYWAARTLKGVVSIEASP
ncbi:MAG: hypothetical protein A2945_00015 [Candidatus Liptonbacteria bacterium RIFCSPLOWO2_01_FULL_52_25]|uniref:Uncharacterized protein n=1 Tax=Candidatus Liptonbacteria bacterium RIFCSPLOWO2_01_FULL_52_25 TaxID=1798650 RepID=A0A1G2CF93_9BACT|nr:MAG: hypothetical protein A2945_00015 [Candidatus Liptonbacteria bacterium RIFCSPLOWO2_01_FULL_52_25]